MSSKIKTFITISRHKCQINKFILNMDINDGLKETDIEKSYVFLFR